jgi:hypothetical protein
MAVDATPGSTPHSKIPTPWGLPDPNIHSLGRHREPGSQDPEQLQCYSQGSLYFVGYVVIQRDSPMRFLTSDFFTDGLLPSFKLGI